MAKTTRYLALLRGIIVGGNNVIAKEDLKQCFEDLGCENVRTYIQSGNILFRNTSKSIRKLTGLIEKGLSQRFDYAARAVVMSAAQYSAAIAASPDKWGQADDQKHNALFTLSDITPEQVVSQLPPAKPNIETVGVGPGVVFSSVSKKHLSKTTMMVLSKSSTYKLLTVRNHNTVFKLQELFATI